MPKPVFFEQSDTFRTTVERLDGSAQPRVHAAIKKLESDLQGERLSHGTNPQLLGADTKYYSFRLSLSYRALAVRQYIHEQCCWYFMDLFTDHDAYEKAIDPRKNAKYAAIANDWICGLEHPTDAEQNGNSGSKEDSQSSASAHSCGGGGFSKEEISWIQTTNYKDKILCLTTDQQTCAKKVWQAVQRDQSKELRFHALSIMGPAGAGKTLIGGELIERFLSEPTVPSVIYMAESSHLRRCIADQFSGNDKLTTMNYQSLLASLGLLVETPDGKFEVKADEGEANLKVVDNDHFEKFFRTQSGATQKRSGGGGHKASAAYSKKASGDVTFEQFVQECSVMTGTLKDYLALNADDSLFHGNDEIKNQLWKLFETYKTLLKKENAAHLDFYIFNTPTKSSTPMIVDECFDLSRMQWKNLFNLCPQMILLGDFNQALADSSYKIGFLEDLIKEARGKYFILHETHRSSLNATQVANNFLKFKDKFPLRSSIAATQVETLSFTPGSVQLWGKTKQKRMTTLCGNVGTAVIEHPEAKPSLREMTGQLFSPKGCKGLGFQTIILVNFGEETPEAAETFAKDLLEFLNATRSSKHGLTSKELALVKKLKEIYAAVTRAETHLVFYCTANISRFQSTKKLIKMIVAGISANSEEDLETTSASTEKDWRERAEELRNQGFEKEADAILTWLEKQNAAATPIAQTQQNPATQSVNPKSLIFTFTPKSRNSKSREQSETFSIDFSKPLDLDQVESLLALHEKNPQALSAITYVQFIAFLTSRATGDTLTDDKKKTELLSGYIELYCLIKTRKNSNTWFNSADKSALSKLSNISDSSVAASLLFRTDCSSLLSKQLDFSNLDRTWFSLWLNCQYAHPELRSALMPEDWLYSLFPSENRPTLSTWYQNDTKSFKERMKGFLSSTVNQDGESFKNGTPLYLCCSDKHEKHILINWFNNDLKGFKESILRDAWTHKTSTQEAPWVLMMKFPKFRDFFSELGIINPNSKAYFYDLEGNYIGGPKSPEAYALIYTPKLLDSELLKRARSLGIIIFGPEFEGIEQFGQKVQYSDYKPSLKDYLSPAKQLYFGYFLQLLNHPSHLKRISCVIMVKILILTRTLFLSNTSSYYYDISYLFASALAFLYINLILIKQIENSGQIFYNNPSLRVVLIPEGCKVFDPEKELPVFIEYPVNIDELSPDQEDKFIKDFCREFFEKYAIVGPREQKPYIAQFTRLFSTHIAQQPAIPLKQKPRGARLKAPKQEGGDATQQEQHRGLRQPR